jgi:Spy/CpxP family protein refolding chaperone
MNTHNDTNANDANHAAAAAPRPVRRWAIAAVLAVAAGTVCTSFAIGRPILHGHHGHMAMSPEAMQAHIGKMVEQCAADADSAQKARLAAIANAAVADLRPVHEQFREDHARAHALLMAAAIDRAALEQWRAAQMQRMDLISRRVLAAVEDGAELLTPEQRAKCAGRLGTSIH